MSKLTDIELRSIYSKAFSEKSSEGIVTAGVAALRAIEAAATEPLLQRIAELERQLEEARKDAERLDWMIFYSASLNHGNDGEYCRVVWRDHEFGEQATRLFGDSREAIDAAMQKDQS